MKPTILYIIIALLQCNIARSATVLESILYVGSADDIGLWTFPASEFPQNPIPEYSHYGLSGGQMLISPVEGETILSATISATYTAGPNGLDDKPYDHMWTLTLDSVYPSVGSTPGDQLWKQVGPYGNSPPWWGIKEPYSGTMYIKVKFEVITTEGVFVDDNEGIGYRGIQIPEPSSILMSSLVAIGLIRRRR